MSRSYFEVLVMPTIDELMPGEDPDNPSDEGDIFYNQYCTDMIKQRLETKKENGERVELKTQYPKDTVTEDFDSRDTVTLDDDGEIIVIDYGDDGS